MMAHHPNCVDFRVIEPGFSAATGDRFIEKYRDRFANFPIDTYKQCLGCCLAYLTVDRNYTSVVHDHQPGLFYVHFSLERPHYAMRIPPIPGFATASNGVLGQIATLPDITLGNIFRRTFQASRTYQLYVPYDESARGLSIGFPCTARMESVAIDVVNQIRHRDIADIKLNFADAMLVERYKEMSDKPRVRTSFQGYCMTPTELGQVGALAEGFQNLAINE